MIKLERLAVMSAITGAFRILNFRQDDREASVMTADIDGTPFHITQEDVCDLVSEVIRLRLEASSLKLDGES